jgi:hypothetical protein
MSYAKIIESGLKAADRNMCDQDKIWSRYSHDKVDVGEVLAKVIRTLSVALPLNVSLRALLIGSSDEPQFRILETAFRGGLYLLDINNCALDIVKERIKRQHTDHVTTIKDDYNRIFITDRSRDGFLRHKLNNGKVHLVTLHHSLYYCMERNWLNVFTGLYAGLLAPKSAIHAVLMSSGGTHEFTTTWLYNHFAGKFFGVRNGQNLRKFKKKLKGEPAFKKAQVYLRTNRVYFDVNDFAKFMAVVWMILLYPNVHKYSLAQREEITEFVYKKFYKKHKFLIQEQDHLVVYKGIRFKGLI